MLYQPLKNLLTSPNITWNNESPSYAYPKCLQESYQPNKISYNAIFEEKDTISPIKTIHEELILATVDK